MFKIEYDMFTVPLISDFETFTLDTLEDVELLAVAGCCHRLGVNNVAFQHIDNLEYLVYAEFKVVGRIKITSVNEKVVELTMPLFGD